MSATFTELNSIEALDQLFIRSKDEPVVLLKHSETCSISSYVYGEMLSADAEVNVVVVQTARDVSDSIAEKTGVRHQSPQAIVLVNEKAVHHASHYDITAEDVQACLARYQVPEKTG